MVVELIGGDDNDEWRRWGKGLVVIIDSGCALGDGINVIKMSGLAPAVIDSPY